MLLPVKEAICECPTVRNSLFRVCPFHLVGVLGRLSQCWFFGFSNSHRVCATISRLLQKFAIMRTQFVLWKTRLIKWTTGACVSNRNGLSLSLFLPSFLLIYLNEWADVNHNVSRGASLVTKIYAIHMFCSHCCHQFWCASFCHRNTPEIVANFGSCWIAQGRLLIRKIEVDFIETLKIQAIVKERNAKLIPTTALWAYCFVGFIWLSSLCAVVCGE